MAAMVYPCPRRRLNPSACRTIRPLLCLGTTIVSSCRQQTNSFSTNLLYRSLFDRYMAMAQNTALIYSIHQHYLLLRFMNSLQRVARRS